MNNQINTAVVTGGAGFIGSNLANHLSSQGVDVTVVDDLSIGTLLNLDESVELVDESVVRYSELPENTDVVYHLAALSSLDMHEDGGATEGCRVNVEGFVNIAEQANDSNASLVFVSTSSVYGTHTEPAVETQDLEANTAYEASKLARERYAQYYMNYHDMHTVGLRLFSIYQGMSYNEGHKDRYGNVISQFAEAMNNGDSPVVYGDGTQTRDFTHVKDAVRAFEHALDAESGVYNIGSQNVRTFNQVVDEINKNLGTDIEPDYVENPIPEDVYVFHQRSSYEKFAEETG
jgi:UDP-glucose 4-epimerase